MDEQKFSTLAETLANLQERLGGFRGVMRYVTVALFLLLIFNFRAVVTEVIGIFDDIQNAIHDEKIERRDEMMIELTPILAEFRGYTTADRILYIEYHNSKENLVGMPFKFLDLVLVSKKYGTPEFDIKSYHELNAGIISPIFPSLKKDGYIINAGTCDSTFMVKYHDVADFIKSQDNSSQQVYLNLPGVNSPIGVIILEWMSDEERDWDEIQNISREYVARINGLILSYSDV